MGNSVGVTVGGVYLFNYIDTLSYCTSGSTSVWTNLAPFFEIYDLDVCSGHAANGDYHHHNHPVCLAEKLSDTGTSHSPLYGWIWDNYPIYGPYQASGELAQSCWQKRDYSSSATGCSGGTRSCVFVDQYDITKGTTTAACSGPSLSGTTTTQSGNTISAASGIYFEDYYYNSTCAAQGGAYLDQYNGHSHGSYGYHYHFTIDSTGANVFPFVTGPKYYGCVSSSLCSTSVCGVSAGYAAGTNTCS